MSSAMKGNIWWLCVFRLSQDRGYQTRMRESPPRAGRDWSYSWKFGRTNPFRSFPHFKLGRIIICGVFRICMEIVIGDRNVKELIVLVVHIGSSNMQFPRSSVGLHITSLNSHFWLLGPRHTMLEVGLKGQSVH